MLRLLGLLAPAANAGPRAHHYHQPRLRQPPRRLPPQPARLVVSLPQKMIQSNS